MPLITNNIAAKEIQNVQMNLDTVPYEVLREIVSYIDVGHIISVAQVNRVLRNSLPNDTLLWSSRLRRLPETEWFSDRTTISEGFREIIKCIPTRRCSECLAMETCSGSRFMQMSYIFGKPVCDTCRQSDKKYLLIPANVAKTIYLVDHDDV